MQKDTQKAYYEILEVSPDASVADVKNSYLHLKDLYSNSSIASIPLEDEITESERKEIMDKIDDAYQKLMALLESDRQYAAADMTQPADDEAVLKLVSEIETFNGAALRKIREKMGVRLEDVVNGTRIQTEHLINLESESFDQLPAEVYTRGFVASYAEFLSIEPDRVVGDYMRLYKEWKSNHRKGSIASLFSMFKSNK